MSQAWAFLATLALEAPFAVVITRGLGRRRAWWWAVAAAVLGSAVTHPLLWWAGQTWALPAGSGWPVRMVALEVGVALGEAVFYAGLCRLSVGRALAASAATNAFSFLAGLGIQALGWAMR